MKITIPKRQDLCYNIPMYRLRIREVAERKGYNQSSLSRASDISFTTIRKIWHNPYYEINVVTLHKLARVLQVPTSELIEDIDEQ